MKRGCCVGYSKLMKAFCDYYGISCTLVSGTDHMWNAIQINGKWYALDVTWDDADGKQKNSKEQYQYFLKGEKTFLADVSHRVVNCMFIQDKVPITEYACLTAPILEKGDYGTHTSVKKSTANTKITVRSGVKYKITNTKKKTAAVIGASSKSIKKAVIAKTVKINKKTYKVTAISKNAFKNCKKLKKVIIQQGKLSIGKNAFKGINKKAAFKVPKKNLKSYKKMLSTQITAEGEGVVDFVDATTIRILYDRTEEEEFVSFESALKEYTIPKWRRTNQNMTIDLRPICEKGQRVTKGQILTEGYSTEQGELALGKNLLVAYMPWKGYNYEDAIVLNERVVREDLLTSVHVEEYSLEVRETKRGMEELTSDIPNVSEEATKDLDENGIVRVGARIEPGDILIGKITPKGESDPSPEEKLLRAIFGDKAGDVKDASLKASPSLKGVIIGKRLFSRVIKTRSSKLADKALLPKIDDEFDGKVADLKKILVNKLLKLTERYTSEGVKDYMGAEVISKGAKFSASDFSDMDFTAIQLSNWTKDEHTNGLIRALVMNFIKKYKELDAELKRKKFAITIGDELPAGIIQMAKVYIAKKRKIGVGDKMAGRHGNKGIVSRVVRQEDMPFLADGTPVDIVLNPLGVPSRMNIGQIFEAVLGRAGKNLGVKFATPIFDGATLDDLNEWTDKAGLPRYGKTTLYDGGTGEAFEQQATVGVTYMLKLGHMVEDKMHARSIGPYSLITQQPLGGKAQFGGQRFGEMEVWALEAFGAAHILQEILTIKSDDVVGRSKAYEAIVKGEPMPAPGIPESLNVLLHELRGLGLSINLE